MHTINHALEEKVLESEGRYLKTQELHSLEQFAQSYAVRLETYQNLGEKSADLVLNALRLFGQEYPEVMAKSGKRCHYDMTSVLRYIALSILRDDELFFIEELMSWLDTVLVAYKRNHHCASAYQHLMNELKAALPASNVDLIRPYIDSVITQLQSHAKQ